LVLDLGIGSAMGSYRLGNSDILSGFYCNVFILEKLISSGGEETRNEILKE
jgi:hypothetical protein